MSLSILSESEVLKQPQLPAACHVCKGQLSELSGFPVANQVTSDCRPWFGSGHLVVCKDCGIVQKPVTKKWLLEVEKIYAGYAVYEQGGGVEQVSFDQNTGAGFARSEKIVDWLYRQGVLPKTGSLLDIGCGNGVFLRAFGAHNPCWQMAGLELDTKNSALIESIPGVTQLYVGSIESLKTRFDLIVLIHALEHIPNPVDYLKSLSSLLNPGGFLLIQVPDLEASPFDILIADHCTHFSSETLLSVVDKSDFDCFRFEAVCVPKELTLLAKRSILPDECASTDHSFQHSALSTQHSALSTQHSVIAHIAWLQKIVQQGKTTSSPLGIFGTSISATWLAAALGNKVSFFVDEDSNRIGRGYLGCPIYAPKDAPKDLALLIPLRTDIATAVSQRLAHFNLQCIIPPL